jgi:hypothetical protein
MPEIGRGAKRITTQTVRIVAALATTFVAMANSGCATLMQPAMRPTAALVDPDWSGGSSVPDALFTTPSADGEWTTRVIQYRTTAGPNTNVAKM